MVFSLFMFLVLVKLKFKSELQVPSNQFSYYSFYPWLQATERRIKKMPSESGKIVPPSRSDKIQVEEVAAKKRYEVETKISSDKDNF